MTTYQVRMQFFVKPLEPSPQRGWKLDSLQVLAIVDAETEEEAVKIVAQSATDAIAPGKLRGELWHHPVKSEIPEHPPTDPAPFDPMAEPEEPLVP